MLSEKFRLQLRQEAEHWWTEGLIDAALYEKLSARYQFNQLEGEASSRFTSILIGVGAVLLGLGAITFVAANWQEWSRSLRVVLLLSCFVGVNLAGFWLWQRPAHPKYQRLGQGLLLLGALLLGANMALMSQMFHQSGHLYELFLVWGLGVVAMSYSLRLTSLGVLALILVGLGYFGSWADWSTWREFGSTNLLVQHLPLLVSVVFVPLAYWCRSRAIFGLSAIAVAVAFVFNLRPLTLSFYSGSALPNGIVAAIALVVPPALLWSYRDRFWERVPTPLVPQPFQAIARSVAVWFLGITFYLSSFQWFWTMDTSGDSTSAPTVDWIGSLLPDILILTAFAIWGWLRIATQAPRRFRLPTQALNSGTIAIFLLLMGLLFAGQTSIPAIVSVFGCNVLLFLLSYGLLRDGLAIASRRTFWGGMVLLILGIVSRMLEYDTELILKSIVFAICGIGVIVAGLWFERNVKPPHAHPPLPPSEETL